MKHCENVNATYEYDIRERLVQSTEVNNLTFEEKICTYEYDKVSNRTKKIENGVETVYTYNKLNQMVKSVETDGANSYTTTYEYDNNGNQTKIVDGKTGVTTTNTYDVYCQLRSVTITKDGEETKTQQNVYNDEGQRISKTENGVKTCYYYEGSNVIYTTDGSGNKTTLNIYGVEENVVASVRYEDDGQHSYSYSKDIQSSTYAITDEDGFFVVGYEYGDFGETEKIGESTFYNEI